MLTVVEGNPFFSFLFYINKVWWAATLFYSFYLFHTFIITFIQYVHSYPFTEASLPFLHFISSFITIDSTILYFIQQYLYYNVYYYYKRPVCLLQYRIENKVLLFLLVFAQREKTPWGAEPGFELGPAIKQASALPTEPCCTLPVRAMLHPIWAMLHPIEPRCTLCVSLWRYTEFLIWKKSRNSLEFRRNCSQFPTEYGIDGSKKKRTEFRGHPTFAIVFLLTNIVYNPLIQILTK